MITINNEHIPRIKEIFEYPIHIILLYVYIFQPPFISRTEYFWVELVIFIVIAGINPFIIKNIVRYFKGEFIFLIIILIYVVFRDFYSGYEVYTFKILSFVFQTFIFSTLIVFMSFDKNKSNFKNPDLIAILFWVAIFAAASSVILLMNENLNNYYNSIILQVLIEREINTFIYRGYGVAENLTFTYPYILGFFVGYLLYFTKSVANYLLFIPLLLAGIAINARIGFIPIFLFLFLFLFRNIKFGGILKIIIYSFILIIAIPKISVFKYFVGNKDWLLAFFTDFYNIFTNSNNLMRGESTIRTIFTDFIILPKSTSGWIFGHGTNLFLGQVEGNSDLGFIVQLFYGGITFVIALLCFLFFIFRRLVLNFGAKYWFTIIFIISLLIINTKGSFFTSTPGSRFFFLIYIYLIFSSSIEFLRLHPKLKASRSIIN